MPDIPLRDGRRIVVDGHGNGRIVDAEWWHDRPYTSSERSPPRVDGPGNHRAMCQPQTPNPPRRSPRKPKQPNATELRYAQDWLQPRIGSDSLDGNAIVWFEFELFSIRMPPAKRYTPDWVVLNEYGKVEFHEVKGNHKYKRHGIERFRWAKERWGQWFRFVLAKWDGTEWEIET
jgi:hypothetical protein